ncbi:lytic transglycosylase domain-containing protein [Tellurirhabdus rosea]|uniref:lytic transglycosylase domain-containing protein n=1 Tax=Tellurirhabdus rosea TaxID=2674997 RepID=UPI0022524DB3|nr:lytic transglycosylase domain-containing protein [Tellurirhabdus rosea]
MRLLYFFVLFLIASVRVMAAAPAAAGLPPVYFCGEEVPTHERTVARRLVSTLTEHATYNRSLYRLRLRASVFFREIEPILNRYQIPSDFKYLPLVESALRSGAVSPKGAVGYWQLMPATARELGLSVRTGHDERRNLIKSTDAACRYLRHLYGRLGSWTLVAAAYNAGIGNLLRNIHRQQEVDYYYLKLNPETGRYLYRIVAFKELFTNYRNYEGIIPALALATLSTPLPGNEFENTDDVLIPEQYLEVVEQSAEPGVIEVKNLPQATRQEWAEVHNEAVADIMRNGVKARLVESAGLQPGQMWVFSLTRSTTVGGLTLDEGDLLYAMVETVDVSRNKLFFRVEKAYSRRDKLVVPALLSAVNAATGQTGIPLPDLDEVRAGWTVTLKPL